MASALFNGYKVNAIKGAIAPLTDTIKCALLTSSYSPDIDNNKFFSDVNANESSGTNYTAGGMTMASITITEDDVNNYGVFGAANVSWPTSTIANARYAVIYKSTGSASTSPLMCVIDFGSTQSSSGSTFTIQWNASGIFYLG